MNNKCPNCGAPVTDIKCEYCGTIIDTGASHTDIDKLKRELQRLEFQFGNEMLLSDLNYKLHQYIYE